MATAIKSYKDLDVWKRGVELSLQVYKITATFPVSELYGLTSQIRRAAVSVPSNIAEGHNRAGHEYARFISIALGSLAEMETQILIALRLNLLSETNHNALAAECAAIGKMLRAIQKRLDPRP